MKMRCLIVDDEPLAIRIVESYCRQVPELEVIGSCNNAIDALALLRRQPIDLLFLDIKMPKLLGTDFLRSLIDPPRVILITAYREYALDGYELDIVDYLLKPVSFVRFIRAVEKAARLLSAELPSTRKSDDNGVTPDPFLYFRIDRENVKVLLTDILFIESRKEYARLYLEDGRTLLVRQSISSLEKLLSPHRFLRVHRSYMVTTEKITSFTATNIRINDHNIPIGRLYKNNVDQALARGK